MSKYPNRDEEEQDFADDVTVKAKQNLRDKGKNSSGKLSRSLKTRVNHTRAGASLEFFMEAYGQGIDAGRKGTRSSRGINTKSLFHPSRAGQPPIAPIVKWIRQKPVSQRGNKIPIRSLAYVIARSIGRKGSRASMFFTDAFNTEFKPFPDDLAKSIGEDVENIIEDSLDNIPDEIGN